MYCATDTTVQASAASAYSGTANYAALSSAGQKNVDDTNKFASQILAQTTVSYDR